MIVAKPLHLADRSTWAASADQADNKRAIPNDSFGNRSSTAPKKSFHLSRSFLRGTGRAPNFAKGFVGALRSGLVVAPRSEGGERDQAILLVLRRSGTMSGEIVDFGTVLVFLQFAAPRRCAPPTGGG